VVSASRRLLGALGIALLFAGTVVNAGQSPQDAFVKSWVGRSVVVKRTLFTLVYNAKGAIGTTSSGKRDGLVVVTPFEGEYLRFDGRGGRDDVVGRDPRQFVDAVKTAYAVDSTEVRSYRTVEPLMVARYDAGVELIVKDVRVGKDTVKLTFVQPSGPDGPDAIVTSLTVKWPLPFSKTFSERDGVEKLILPYVSAVIPRESHP
jgi:hypothetical protein